MIKQKNTKVARIAIFVLLLLLVVAFFISRDRQKSTFNDSDLIFIRPAIPVESNAFWTLLKATNELYWPKSLARKLNELSDNTNWDDSLATEVLSKNQTCLDLFNKSVDQPFLSISGLNLTNKDYSYLYGWKAISRVESIHVISLFRAKNEKEALASALRILKFGQRAENSDGGVIAYLFGSAIKTMGLFRIQEITAHSSLQQADLFKLIRELDDFRPNKEGITNALKLEYQTDCRYIDDLAAGNVAGAGTTNSAVKPNFYFFGVLPVFSPTKTKMEFAQSVRFIRDNCSKPFGGIPWSDLPGPDTNAPTWIRLVSGNAVGNIFFEMLNPSLNSFASRISRENVDVTATQLLLALKIYQMRYNKLPDSLSELVPGIIPQVPTDDFDGKPFRYLPGKKIIYSLGPDLKDCGGEGRRTNSENYNLPFKIEF